MGIVGEGLAEGEVEVVDLDSFISGTRLLVLAEVDLREDERAPRVALGLPLREEGQLAIALQRLLGPAGLDGAVGRGGRVRLAGRSGGVRGGVVGPGKVDFVDVAEEVGQVQSGQGLCVEGEGV